MYHAIAKDSLSLADLKVCEAHRLDAEAMAALRLLAETRPEGKARLLMKLLVKGPEVLSGAPRGDRGCWVLEPPPPPNTPHRRTSVVVGDS